MFSPKNVFLDIRVVFNCVLKVIWNSTGFALLRFVIGPENPLYSLNQSYVKVRPITMGSPRFSHDLGKFFVIYCEALYFLISKIWGTLIKSVLP